MDPQDSQSTLACELGRREQGQGCAQAHAYANQKGAAAPQWTKQSGERPARTDEDREDRTQGLPL